MPNHLNDQDYFRHRAQVERESAVRALEPAVRQVHLDMADRYAARVNAPVEERQVTA